MRVYFCFCFSILMLHWMAIAKRKHWRVSCAFFFFHFLCPLGRWTTHIAPPLQIVNVEVELDEETQKLIEFVKVSRKMLSRINIVRNQMLSEVCT